MGYHYIKLLTFFVTLTSANQSISLVKDGCHQPCPVGMMMRRISSTLSCLSNTLHLFLWSLLIAWNELIQTISDITGGQKSARTPPSLLITGSVSPCWGTFPLQVSSSYVEPPSVQFFFLVSCNGLALMCPRLAILPGIPMTTLFETQLRGHHSPTHIGVSHCRMAE